MREDILFTVTTEGRDKGKTYLITEWDVYRCDEWSLKVVFEVLKSVSKLVSDAIKFPSMMLAGIEAEQVILMIGRLDPAVAIPLLKELTVGINFIPDLSKPGVSRSLIKDDIQDGETLNDLRLQVIKANMGFFKGVIGSILKALPEEFKKALLNTEISPT